MTSQVPVHHPFTIHNRDFALGKTLLLRDSLDVLLQSLPSLRVDGDLRSFLVLSERLFSGFDFFLCWESFDEIRDNVRPGYAFGTRLDMW